MDIYNLGKKRAKELGLQTFRAWPSPINQTPYQDCYLVDSIHKLLGEGVIKYGYDSHDGWYGTPDKGENEQEYSALLIGRKPIEKDSAEKILYDLIKLEAVYPARFDDVLLRAKKLLGEK